MSGDKNQLEFTAGDVINALQHGATREDIADLRSDFKSSLSEAKSEFKDGLSKLENKIDNVESDLKKEMDKRFDKLETNMKWGIGLIIAVLGALLFFH